MNEESKIKEARDYSGDYKGKKFIGKFSYDGNTTRF